MRIATTKAMGSIKSNELEKVLPVESPTNGEELFTKVFFFFFFLLLYIHPFMNMSFVSSHMFHDLETTLCVHKQLSSSVAVMQFCSSLVH